jgi:type 1 glutamine amidotransferase
MMEKMDRRDFVKGMLATASAAGLTAETLSAQQQAPAAPAPVAHDTARSRPVENTWPGKKLILAIADPQEWYSSAGYHHDSYSHTLATVERLGRETGLWTTIIRTDMRLLTKETIPGYNVRNLNNFDAIFYMGEGPWNITDQQKADLLSFVHEDGKGFIAGHAGNGGHLLLWPEYAAMIGGNLIGEFPTASMPIVVEDPNFPGVQGFPREFNFPDQYTICGPNFDRSIDHVIMRMDGTKFPDTFAKLVPPQNPGPRGPISPERYKANFERLAALRSDGDYPIVWAKNYGKGRVWYSTFGHLEQTLDDARVQQMYIGAIKWALKLQDADITPHPFPKPGA